VAEGKGVAMAIGALIRRELLRESRQGTHYVTRSLLVGILALLVVWQLLSIGPRGVGSAQAVVAQYGAQLFIIWSLVQYFAAIAFSTVRSGALADERRKGTLPLTRITALGDRGVVLGWFTSVMGRVLFTMVLTVPVLVIVRSFGGFTLGQLAGVVLVTVVAAAHSAALTLAIASLSGSAGAAVAVSLLVQVLLMLRQSVFTGFFGLSSFGLLVAIFEGPMAVGLRTRDALLLVAACMLGLVPVYLKLAVRFLDAPLPRAGRRVKGLFLAADRFFLRSAGKWGVLWKPGLGLCRGNPVLWRERAASPVGQRDHLIRLGYWVMVPVIVVSGLGLLGWGYWDPLFFFECSLLLVPLLLTAVLLLAGPATTFARERQESTLPLLAVTPLSPRTITLGKYIFGLRLLLVPMAFAALFLVCYGVVFGFAPVRRDYLLPFGLWRLLESPAGGPLLLLLWLPVVAAALLYVGLGARSVGRALGAGLAFLGAVPLVSTAAEAFWRQGLVFVGFPNFVRAWYCSVVWISALPLLVLGLLFMRRGRSAANALAVGLLVGWGFVAAWWPLGIFLRMSKSVPAVGVVCAFVVPPALAVLLLWRALSHAGPGPVNRAGLAVVAVWLSYGIGKVLSTLSYWVGRDGWGQAPAMGYDMVGMTLSPGLLPSLVIACGLTVLFLAAATRQLDGFLERNG
jgi:hypothetical protein